MPLRQWAGIARAELSGRDGMAQRYSRVMTIRKFLSGMLALFAGLAAPFTVSAGEVVVRPKAVIELFTSQGCSSCPKADQLLSEMAERPDVVALAWHVDYWDYIGWPDTFGTPENTARLCEQLW